MKIIDQELGGTTPLDVIITLSGQSLNTPTVPEEDEELEEDSFEDEFSSAEDEEQYWFTDEKIKIFVIENKSFRLVQQISFKIRPMYTSMFTF